MASDETTGAAGVASVDRSRSRVCALSASCAVQHQNFWRDKRQRRTRTKVGTRATGSGGGAGKGEKAADGAGASKSQRTIATVFTVPGFTLGTPARGHPPPTT